MKTRSSATADRARVVFVTHDLGATDVLSNVVLGYFVVADSIGLATASFM